jgi:hypothetical protein
MTFRKSSPNTFACVECPTQEEKNNYVPGPFGFCVFLILICFHNNLKGISYLKKLNSRETEESFFPVTS